MRSKEIVVLGEVDKEVKDFLERARAADGLRVQVGSDVFVVKVSNDSVPQSARDFLTKGGRILE